VVAVAQPQQVLDAVALDDVVHRLASGRERFKAPAPAQGERLNMRLGLGHAGSQRHLGGLGVAHRAHPQTALAPRAFLPI
jgi:hypothetical protein